MWKLERPRSCIEWQANRKINILLIHIFGSLRYFVAFLISPCLAKRRNVITDFLKIESNVIVFGANIIRPVHNDENI